MAETGGVVNDECLVAFHIPFMVEDQRIIVENGIVQVVSGDRLLGAYALKPGDRVEVDGLPSS